MGNSFIRERIKCKFHPYIMEGCGWKRYPPQLAQLLNAFEPLHVIGLTKTECIVDGAAVLDGRSLREKREAALSALMEEFGEAAKKREFGFNIELIELEDPYAILLFYEGGVWFVSLCVKRDACPERFVFIADGKAPCLPTLYTSGKVLCAAVSSDRFETTFSISEEFFKDPRPENAALLGDLFFLAQMGGDWVVTREIKVDLSCHYIYFFFFSNPYKSIARILRKTPGVRSLLRYAYIQIMMGGGEYADDWRIFLKTLEETQCAPTS